jgi:hypothetical protein
MPWSMLCMHYLLVCVDFNKLVSHRIANWILLTSNHISIDQMLVTVLCMCYEHIIGVRDLVYIDAVQTIF